MEDNWQSTWSYWGQAYLNIQGMGWMSFLLKFVSICAVIQIFLKKVCGVLLNCISILYNEKTDFEIYSR